MIFPKNGKECVEITKIMKKLHKQPFEKHKCQTLKRGNIISYELGEVLNFVVFDIVSQEDNKIVDDTIYEAKESLGKMGMADVLIQLRFMCMDYGWNFDDLQSQGLKHRIERQKEIEKSY